MTAMGSSRPYLIRALHEWIVDNGMTPHILVDAGVGGCHVPGRYVRDGQIVLNISPSAAQGLRLSNDEIAFSARFGGVATDISVPPAAVLAIYARENGEGMVFRDGGGPPSPPEPSSSEPAKGGKPALRVVK